MTQGLTKGPIPLALARAKELDPGNAAIWFAEGSLALRDGRPQEAVELLRQGKADLGFVQGGTADIGYDDEESIVSLGSLFVEPLWLFYREDSARRLKGGPPTALTDLKGWRVNVGTPGSGVPQLFRRLLEANRLSPADLQLQQLEQTPGTMAFLDGTVDAMVFASAPEAMMVQMLLQTPGVRLLPFTQAQAYARRLGFLTPVTLPQGVVDLAKNLPAKDVPLVASTTSLLARADTHPALLQLFAQNAQTLHGGAGFDVVAGNVTRHQQSSPMDLLLGAQHQTGHHVGLRPQPTEHIQLPGHDDPMTAGVPPGDVGRRQITRLNRNGQRQGAWQTQPRCAGRGGILLATGHAGTGLHRRLTGGFGHIQVGASLSQAGQGNAYIAVVPQPCFDQFAQGGVAKPLPPASDVDGGIARCGLTHSVKLTRYGKTDRRHINLDGGAAPEGQQGGRHGHTRQGGGNHGHGTPHERMSTRSGRAGRDHP